MSEWLPEIANRADHAGVEYRRGDRFAYCTCGKRFFPRSAHKRWHKHLQKVAVIGYRNVRTDELLVPNRPDEDGVYRSRVYA